MNRFVASRAMPLQYSDTCQICQFDQEVKCLCSIIKKDKVFGFMIVYRWFSCNLGRHK